MTDPLKSKSDWRYAIKNTVLAFLPEQKRIWDDAIIVAAWKKIIDLKPARVALYVPLPHEVNCFALQDKLSAQKIDVLLPVIVAKDKPLQFKNTVTETIDIPDIVVVPMLGLHPSGYRLGHGGGLYDRTLPLLKAMAIGLAYETMTGAFPLEAHDHRLDCVITEKGVKIYP